MVFNINQLNKLTIKIYSNLSIINIHYHLKLGSTPFASSIFSQTYHKIVIIFKTHCNDRRNTFLFACHQWYSYNNPQCDMVYLYLYE